MPRLVVTLPKVVLLMPLALSMCCHLLSRCHLPFASSLPQLFVAWPLVTPLLNALAGCQVTSQWPIFVVWLVIVCTLLGTRAKQRPGSYTFRRGLATGFTRQKVFSTKLKVLEGNILAEVEKMTWFAKTFPGLVPPGGHN
jgi:hypothetical protein